MAPTFAISGLDVAAAEAEMLNHSGRFGVHFGLTRSGVTCDSGCRS